MKTSTTFLLLIFLSLFYSCATPEKVPVSSQTSSNSIDRKFEQWVEQLRLWIEEKQVFLDEASSFENAFKNFEFSQTSFFSELSDGQLGSYINYTECLHDEIFQNKNENPARVIVKQRECTVLFQDFFESLPKPKKDKFVSIRKQKNALALVHAELSKKENELEMKRQALEEIARAERNFYAKVLGIFEK